MLVFGAQLCAKLGMGDEAMANAFSIVSGDIFESSLLGLLRGQVRPFFCLLFLLSIARSLFRVFFSLCFLFFDGLATCASDVAQDGTNMYVCMYVCMYV